MRNGVGQLANIKRGDIQLADMKRTPGSCYAQGVATSHTFLTWKSIGWVSVRGLCCGMLSTQPAPTLQNSGGMYKSSYRLLTSGMVLTRVLGGNLGASHLYRPACRGGEWGDRERERDLERDREDRLWTFAGERDRPRLGGGLRGLQYQHIYKFWCLSLFFLLPRITLMRLAEMSQMWRCAVRGLNIRMLSSMYSACTVCHCGCMKMITYMQKCLHPRPARQNLFRLV